MTAILESESSVDLVIRVVLAASVAAISTAVATLWPRVAYRLAVPAGDSPHPACRTCGLVFAPRWRGWVRAGSDCPRCPRQWWPLVAATAAASAGLTWQLADPASPRVVQLISWLIIVQLGSLLSLIDLQVMRLPTPLVAGLGAVAVGGALVPFPQRIVPALTAGAIVGLLYLLAAILSPRMVGMGDVRLAAVLSIALGAAGWSTVALGVALPYVLALPMAVTRRKQGDERNSGIPFGPFLIAGAVLATIVSGA